ncbi:flagellar biosynthetic protein FliR [Rubripirellula amarantea]|uniref:Flagellar biosynthesis protein FliR n=1 Tax=Rubripirellula amarantea TaxID=2527999 RepID=A0A5C5WSN6_9BACT|nr:flagellar biosynthetic protein FliR [Rubripirellula amarantea]MDA8746171.1 flagellar biosynthetic protein FliR [Rubripirellula amarantea]TWT53165.1 flagellar biosynthesis protein FliR [Rubripirellula amarantea]
MEPVNISELTQWFVDHLILGVLILTRLSLLLMAMPAVGVGVPKRVRAILAILVTTLLMPAVANLTSSEALPRIDNLIDLTIAIAREGMIGMLIGATVQLIITGMQLGGEAITSTGGMQLGDAIDPTTASSMPSIARLVGLLVTSIMLAVGGHRLVLNLLLDSFKALPAGQIEFSDSMMTLVVDQLTAGMIAGIRVAAPVVAALLLANLVTGLVSRTLPQINVLAIGLSINALSMLIVLALTIGSAGLIFQDELAQVAVRLGKLW